MNAAMQLSAAVMSGSTSGSVSQARIDADRGEDLYSLWNSIFEHARPDAMAGDESPASGAAPVDAGSNDPARVTSRDDALQRRRGDATLHAGAAESPATGALASVANNVAADEAGCARQSGADWRGSGFDPFMAASARIDTTQTETSVSRRFTPDEIRPPPTQTSAAAATQPAPSESVFLRGETVSIVVRDAGMSEQDAVQSAFDAAAELTGERAGLRQLILNGRLLYRHPGDPGAQSLPSARALVFAC